MRIFLLFALPPLAAIALVLYVRGQDPRPVTAEMRARLAAAGGGIETAMPGGLDADRGFVGLMLPYHRATAGMAEVALDYVTDPDIVDFAQKLLAERPAAAAALEQIALDATDTAGATDAFAALNTRTIDEMNTAIAHIGTPDEIFVRTMLALHAGSVASAELELAEGDVEALRTAAEDILLLHKSAIGSMNRWLADTAHAH